MDGGWHPYNHIFLVRDGCRGQPSRADFEGYDCIQCLMFSMLWCGCRMQPTNLSLCVFPLVSILIENTH